MEMPSQQDDQAVAETMIKIHGAYAIREAEALLHYSAALGDRDGAAKWLRVMALVEFSELRRPRSHRGNSLAA